MAGEGWRGGLCRVNVRKRREERKQLGERGRRPRSCSFFSRVFLRLTSTFHLPGTFKRTCACVGTSEAGIKSDCQMYLPLAFFWSLPICLSICPSPSACVWGRNPKPAFHVQDTLLFSPDFGLKGLQLKHFLVLRLRKEHIPYYSFPSLSRDWNNCVTLVRFQLHLVTI